MSTVDAGQIKLGAVVQDVTGRDWVYLGYTTRPHLPHLHRFAIASQGQQMSQPQWIYDVVNLETMLDKFPNLKLEF